MTQALHIMRLNHVLNDNVKKKPDFFLHLAWIGFLPLSCQRVSENCELKSQSSVYAGRKHSAERLGEGSVDPHPMLQGEGSGQLFPATGVIYFSLSVLMFT